MKGIYYDPLLIRIFLIIMIIVTVGANILIMTSSEVGFLIKLIFLIINMFFLISIFNILSKRIYINDKGVKYKDLQNTYFIEWEKISKIGMAMHKPGSRSYINVICFTTKDEKIVSFGRRKLSNEFIYFVANKKVLELVRQNWNGDIIDNKY